MKSMKNSRFFIAVVVAVIAIAATGSSLAYFFAQKDHDSNYRVAAIDTEIDEKFEKVDESTFNKNPKIKNVGKSDCIIRVKVVVSPETEAVQLKGLQENQQWVYHEEDGYYYYQGVVAPNEETNELFNQVKITDTKNTGDFDIIVYNEAIQTHAFDEKGNEISSLENGQYNQQNALKLWSYYQ